MPTINNFWKVIITIIVFFVIWVIWHYLGSIVAYLLSAAFLTMLGAPIMGILRRFKIGKYKLPKSVCALLIIFGFYALLASFIALFVPLIVEQINNLSSLNVDKGLKNVESSVYQFNDFLKKYQLAGETDPILQIKAALQNFFNKENIFNIFGTAFGFLGNIVGIITALFAVTFIWFFFLTDNELLYKYSSMFIPTEYERGFDNVVNTSRNLLTRYIFGILVQLSFVTIFVTTGMFIFGVKYALLIGFFAGLANIIPYVGPLIGLSFALFVGITTNLDLNFMGEMLPMIIKIGIVFASMQAIDNMLLQPFIFSNSVKAHPLEIFIIILVAGTLAGVGGMIIAIPFYTIIRVVAKEFMSEFKFVKTLTSNM